jgi:arylsulfatase
MLTRFAAALAPLALQAAPSEPAPRPPNVVLFVADDLGWGELGCYGQAKIRTPHLDRLAAEGLRFTQYYAGAPVCAPSRCVMLTGLHSGHAFIRDNAEVMPEGQLPIPSETVTLAERLRALGYATGGFGKWGLGGPGSTGEPLEQGFERWFGYLCQRRAQTHWATTLWSDRERVAVPKGVYAPDLIADRAIDFLRARAREARPFFLYVPFTLPHLALQVPDEELAIYADAWPETPYDGSLGYAPHAKPRAAYAAMVTHLDTLVGRVVGELAALGVERDSLVLFISDNGPVPDGWGGTDSAFFDSTGPLRGFKGSVYEGGLRAPLIARWPGKIAAGGTSDLVCAAQDLVPTLLEIAGAPPSKGLDGISLAPVLLGTGEAAPREHLYFEFTGYGAQQAVRLGRWKAVRRDLALGRETIELYDLETDVGETRDVAKDHPEVVARVKGILAREHSRSREFPLPSVDR